VDVGLARAVRDEGLPQLIFNCYELMVPPVLSASFHQSLPPPVEKLGVSSWFATRCCLMEDVGPKLGAVLSNSDPSLTKKKAPAASPTIPGWMGGAERVV
jgi:hypothetical protein